MHFALKSGLLILTCVIASTLAQAQQYILTPEFWSASKDSSFTDSSKTMVSEAKTDSTSTDSTVKTSDFYVLQMPDSAYYGNWEMVDSDSLDFELQKLDDNFFAKSDIEVIEKKPVKQIKFKVQVIDTVTGVPVQSEVYMVATNPKTGERNKGTGITQPNGDFEITVNPDSKFEINVNSMGYFSMSEKIDISEEEIVKGEVVRTYKMRPLQKGDLVRLDNLNFAMNDYQLNKESLLQLEKLISLMKANPKMVIKLEGHTESTASYATSMSLSQKRVNEVRYYLVRKGIDVNRIKAEGYGNTKPLTYEKDDESQKINRRVEFRVLKI